MRCYGRVVDKFPCRKSIMPTSRLHNTRNNQTPSRLCNHNTHKNSSISTIYSTIFYFECSTIRLIVSCVKSEIHLYIHPLYQRNSTRPSISKFISKPQMPIFTEEPFPNFYPSQGLSSTPSMPSLSRHGVGFDSFSSTSTGQ